MTTIASPVTIWACIDCTLMHANGECTETPDREPLSLIPDGAVVTLGTLEHEEWCDPDADECECERMDFSKMWCQACGSTLAGERHALTIWGE